jgi:pyruvate dehydrogenase E2 component (dihydrolipoamide acetyltransferase)
MDVPPPLPAWSRKCWSSSGQGQRRRVLIKVEAARRCGSAPAAGPGLRPPRPGRLAAPAARLPPPAAAGGGVVEVKVPDIGDFSDVPVIELFVKVGDSIKVDDAIATLESDKATMDVPSPPPAWSRKCWSSSAPRSAKAPC